jgi:hypothetical protein
MEWLWQNHEGKKNLYILNINVWKENANVAKSSNEIVSFGTKNSTTSTWRALRSWKKW